MAAIKVLTANTARSLTLAENFKETPYLSITTKPLTLEIRKGSVKKSNKSSQFFGTKLNQTYNSLFFEFYGGKSDAQQTLILIKIAIIPSVSFLLFVFFRNVIPNTKVCIKCRLTACLRFVCSRTRQLRERRVTFFIYQRCFQSINPP